MNLRMILTTATLAVLTPGWTHADLTFVQTLDLGADIEIGDLAAVTVRSQGSKVRADFGTDMSSIIDQSSNSVITVLHEDRTYFSMKNEKAMSVEPVAQAVVFSKTAETDEIAGYQVTAWKGEVDGNKLTAWVTKSVPDQEKLTAALAAVQVELDPFQGLLRGADFDGGFPLRLEIVDQEGQTSKLTLSSFSLDPIPPESFDAPAGYQSLDPTSGQMLAPELQTP